MLYSEIIALCSEIHTKHINATCGQNVEYFWRDNVFVSLEHGVYGWEKVTSQWETRSKDLAWHHCEIYR
jgi:hypothetical protein